MEYAISRGYTRALLLATMAERMEMRDLGGEVALSGQQALDMVRAETPDVIVPDLKMPGMGGLEAPRHVKGTYTAVEVVIMTGHGPDEDAGEARCLAACD